METLIIMKSMSGENLVITFERFTKSKMFKFFIKPFSML